MQKTRALVITALTLGVRKTTVIKSIQNRDHRDLNNYPPVPAASGSSID